MGLTIQAYIDPVLAGRFTYFPPESTWSVVCVPLSVDNLKKLQRDLDLDEIW